MGKGKKEKPDKTAKKKKPEAQKSENGKPTGVKFSLRIKFSLAIIALVSSVVVIMTIYFIRAQSDLLRKEIIKFAEREIEHLSDIAKESISSKDDLPLDAAVKSLKNIPSIKYATVLDMNNVVIQDFDTQKIGTTLNDEATLKSVAHGDYEKPMMLNYPDNEDRGGLIYDFSKPVMYKQMTKDMKDRKRAGTVRLGFSDKIIRDEISKITWTILLIGLFFLALSIVGSVALASITIKPIRKLSEGAAVIGTGNLDYKIDLNRSDELGSLAHEFNIMTDRLKKARDLEVEARLMQEQVDVAKEIQEGLNPMGFYDMNGIQIKGFTRAAKGVGGDYFDYKDIDENRVGALISDVSGKGIPASLVMVMIRTVFVSYISESRNTGTNIETASIVTAINDSLSADFAIDKFATLFFMIYDRTTGEISFTNAGHGPLFCYRSSLNACTVTKLDGVPIGIEDDPEYKHAKVKLNPGDMVILYTDGVTEMRNNEKKEYGRLRMQKMLINYHELNASEIVEKIVADVDEFRGDTNPHDDMTLLVLKRTY